MLKVRTYRNLFEKYHVPRASFWLGFIRRAREHLNYEKIIKDFAAYRSRKIKLVSKFVCIYDHISMALLPLLLLSILYQDKCDEFRLLSYSDKVKYKYIL